MSTERKPELIRTEFNIGKYNITSLSQNEFFNGNVIGQTLDFCSHFYWLVRANPRQTATFLGYLERDPRIVTLEAHAKVLGGEWVFADNSERPFFVEPFVNSAEYGGAIINVCNPGSKRIENPRIPVLYNTYGRALSWRDYALASPSGVKTPEQSLELLLGLIEDIEKIDLEFKKSKRWDEGLIGTSIRYMYDNVRQLIKKKWSTN